MQVEKKRTIWWKSKIEKNKIFCREYAEQRQTKCGHKIQGLLCKDCEQCVKCQTLQKTDKKCNRHKGCPSCYLIKKHGIKIDDEVNKTSKKAIPRKEWNFIIEGTWKSNRKSNNKPDQGTPSKGTAEPPLGGGLRAPNPNPNSKKKSEEKSIVVSTHVIKLDQGKKVKTYKKTWKNRRREGRQCKKLVWNWWMKALLPPKKLSKRQDNNAKKDETQRIRESIKKRTIKTEGSRKYRKIISILARDIQRRKKAYSYKKK